MESAAGRIGEESALLSVHSGDGSVEEELRLRNGHDLVQHAVSKSQVEAQTDVS
jgi:hypothetical protein